MRLQNVDRGHALHRKLFLGLIGLMGGRQVPGVLKTLHYRPQFWGKPYSDLLQDVMRGPSDWSPGERELMAAFTANLLACKF